MKYKFCGNEAQSKTHCMNDDRGDARTFVPDQNDIVDDDDAKFDAADGDTSHDHDGQDSSGTSGTGSPKNSVHVLGQIPDLHKYAYKQAVVV